MRGNFVSVPTDCPQGDERQGWTGDINVFAPTGAFLYGVTGMLQDWLRGLASSYWMMVATCRH
jgi:alpha-L-rhamnosidase